MDSESVTISGPRYGTWKGYQASHDQYFKEHCTLGELELQQQYSQIMLRTIQQRIGARKCILEKYDPLEAQKAKGRNTVNQQVRSTANHERSISFNYSKEEITRQAVQAKKKKRRAESSANGTPDNKKSKLQPPPIPTPGKRTKKKNPCPPPPVPILGKKKKTTVPPPVPAITSAKKKTTVPPPVPAITSAKKKTAVPPPVPGVSSTKKKAVPPPVPSLDSDGDVVMKDDGSWLSRFSETDLEWTMATVTHGPEDRKDLTSRLVSFVDDHGDALGSGTEEDNQILADGLFRAHLDRALLINTILANADRNRKQFRRHSMILFSLHRYPQIESISCTEEPNDSQCYYCAKPIKPHKDVTITLSEHDDDEGHTFVICTTCSVGLEGFHKLVHWVETNFTRILCGEGKEVPEETEHARASILALYKNNIVTHVTFRKLVESARAKGKTSIREVLEYAHEELFYE